MKKNCKKVLIAMMAVLVAVGVAGCGKEKSTSGQQTENANGQTDQLAQAENTEKDSVIVVMGPSSEVSISVARSYPMVRSLFVTVNVLWISGS